MYMIYTIYIFFTFACTVEHNIRLDVSIPMSYLSLQRLDTVCRYNLMKYVHTQKTFKIFV